MTTATDFLKRANSNNGRIVSSDALTIHQIAYAQANNLFYVDSHTGYGWALLPWCLTTQKDRQRERDYLIMEKEDEG